MNILWLQSAGCGGCTMSLLCAEGPNVFDLLAGAGLTFLWHPALSLESGTEVRGILAGLVSGEVPLDILCVEGAIARGPRGTGRYQILSGTGRPLLDWLRDLAPLAAHVVAVGTCATYGGVTTAGGNPSDAVGVQYDGAHPGGALPATFRARAGLPVINIAGCPTHPDWVTETLLMLVAGRLGASDLDALGRPRFYADHLVHHACPKNEFYEYKASARALSEMGCMMEHLGCIGTQAVGDCNIRPWNGQGSCTRGGYPCINCTAPEFEEPRHLFTATPKIAGIPVGLPTDMPKAWFMALASLSKAATPERIAKNAVADRIVTPPTLRKPR
ncbi:HupU protein [Paracoccus methylovorus]|jgi:ferredoxin hydrogenase small subunit|uniref:hydrogenase (acceptor) n=4 Tax=Paracoccus TaxID=265 RepID=A1B6N1_PARDP|nr:MULTISPECIES: NADH ubiquinone dehydrogenase [Paracoccus]ABL71175.1 NADH ubiquinone oxidoreductase, 20 kDa subunit [Paracoccus denitrificans PD1222]MBB4628219.1 ferredoxin hydrogenase small subunit [Paracoccus denitrificans]MCU7429284.1 HupU protein [Paracoccus denitrificans]MDK8873272.1 HupU protein [Paracoccus sp. SSJ]QAR27820.1 HupU protein [Paracoccus denitrificans]